MYMSVMGDVFYLSLHVNCSTLYAPQGLLAHYEQTKSRLIYSRFQFRSNICECSMTLVVDFLYTQLHRSWNWYNLSTDTFRDCAAD